MARPIKETPVLQGKDAARFIQRMNETRIESPEKKLRRETNYKLALSILVKEHFLMQAQDIQNNYEIRKLTAN